MNQPKTLQKFETSKRIAYGIVYEPGVPDAHGDFMTAETVETMAHTFLAEGRVLDIDTSHDMQNNGCYVVESFVARAGDPDFPVGAWVMGVHFPDEAMWGRVLKGDFGGFSLYGQAFSDEAVLELEIPDDGMVWGKTADAGGHQHTYVVKFDEAGNFLGGMTDEVDGHSHVISCGTVTAKVGDHAHRFDFLENFR